MRQDELIQITATSADCSSELVQKIIDTFLDTIMETLKMHDRVELRTDFGSFVVREKGGVLNGNTLTKIQRVVSFKATPTLKKQLRQSDQAFGELLHSKEAVLQIERMKKSKS